MPRIPKSVSGHSVSAIDGTVGWFRSAIIGSCLCVALHIAAMPAVAQDKSACPDVPRVEWWGNLTNGSMVAYVRKNHGGDWAAYVQKWEGESKALKRVHAKGGTVEVRKVGKKLKGAALQGYIAKVDQRVSVIRCLASATGQAVKTTVVEAVEADFGVGLRAYKEGDFSLALTHFQALAQEDDARAQFYLGYMNDKGRGVKKDAAAAFTWWTKAAENGDSRAQHYIAKAYILGRGVDADEARAIVWLKRAAKKGYAKSQYTLGKMYAYGAGIEADPEESYRWTLKAAKSGFDKAQYTLGKMYRDGFGAPQDVAAAASWFLKAARQGYVKAQHHIAVRLARGEGTDKDTVEALKWFLLAERGGNKPAKSKGEALAKLMSDEQRASAQRRAEKWKPKKG